MDQFNIFVRDNIIGYLTVILVGIGRRLGIFQYLYKKAISENIDKNIESVSFSVSELITKLDLNERYLDGWLTAAIEVGLFKIENKDTKLLKTCPYIYDFFIDINNPVFLGTSYGSIYRIVLQEDYVFKNFKTGKLINRNRIPKDIVMEGHRATARMGNRLENYFSKHYHQFQKNLKKEGKILEVGCGYGYNLLNWAKKYKKCSIIGLDIDEEAVNFTREQVLKNRLEERVEVLTKSINEYEIPNDKKKFDLILLNEVLHEMEIDDNYRKNVFDRLYLLLREGGIVLIGESIIEDIFDPNRKPQLLEALHKWQEIGLISKFYSEKSFRELITLTSFKNIELVKETYSSFWVLKK
jgi:2-polyprenyl-3-methyl-5-hydroxy-6-metoxy-1,4-benzoquinol methylase